MVDRRLIGTILIAFTLSSAVFSLILGERVDDPLEILREEWNLPEVTDQVYRLPTGEGRYAYGLGMVIREPVLHLEIFFAILKNESTPISDANISPRILPWESFTQIPETGPLANIVVDYANKTGIRILRQNLQIPTTAGTRQGFIVDLTEPQIPTAPRGTPRTLRTVHAILLNQTGSPEQYFRGRRDFFLDRDNTIIDLSIQRNNNLTKYSQRVTQQGDAHPMDQAPTEGHLVYENLEPDDQIFISFAINPAMVPSRENLLQIILIHINGNPHISLVNTLQR